MNISTTFDDHLLSLGSTDEALQVAAAKALREGLVSSDSLIRESAGRVLVSSLSNGAPEVLGPVASLLQEVVEPFSSALATSAFEAAFSAAERAIDSSTQEDLVLVIVDTKTIEQIGSIERGRMINYLRVTRLPVGLTINFKHPKITWDRVLL